MKLSARAVPVLAYRKYLDGRMRKRKTAARILPGRREE
jgi:hypothetical protein